MDCIRIVFGSCRTYIVSHLQSEEAHGVVVNDTYVIQVRIDHNEVECLCADCNTRSLSRVYGRDNYMYENLQGYSAAKDLSSDGARWEGGVLNKGGVVEPCGYGILYGECGRILYEGYMFKGKKVCYGTEYYEDTTNVAIPLYIGCFYNDTKHGYGMLFDRNGTVIMDSFYLDGALPTFSSPDTIYSYKKSIILWEPLNDISTIVLSKWLLTCLDRVFINSNSLPSIEYFRITDLPLLQSVVFANCQESVVKRKCSYQFAIENCRSLESVRFGDYTFNLFGACMIQNNCCLKSIGFGNYSFSNGINMVIQSKVVVVSELQICQNFVICILEIMCVRDARTWLWRVGLKATDESDLSSLSSISFGHHSFVGKFEGFNLELNSNTFISFILSRFVFLGTYSRK